MAHPFLPYLISEISRLEQLIDRIPEVRQLNELRRVRALYQALPLPAASGPTGPSPTGTTTELLQLEKALHMAAESERTGPGRKMAPDRQKAIDLIRQSLENETMPVKTATLLEYIKTLGIDLGGNDPVNSLSALLSTSGHFQAHGRSGWTLKTRSKSAMGDTYGLGESADTRPGVTIVMQDPEPLAEHNDPHADGENEPFKMRRF